jgi:hypothetical protein
MTLRLTLDTNCINLRQGLAAMNALESLAASGKIKLVTASAMIDDLAFDKSRLAQARLDKANRLLEARGAFMVGHSHVGGYDVLGGPSIYEHVDRIAEALRDGQSWERLDGNSQRDVLHLAAHLANDFEVFVTRDGAILDSAVRLRALGLLVLSPEDALAFVEAKK